MKDIIILAIESSCDETACAIVKNGNEILANKVASQIDVHTLYGGVVPEVASRIHIENISIIIKETLKEANMTVEEVDGIAFTQGPGLIGSLHIGVLAAKTLAWAYNKPLIPVHHLTGHIYSNAFVKELKFPLLALIVSGGHTELVLMKEDYDFQVIGETLDDAIGEAYDKVGRVLNLPYPGGPKIDKLAKEGKPIYKLPLPKVDSFLDFSFSGLKSAVMQTINRLKRNQQKLSIEDMCASFQKTALNALWQKVQIALDTYDVNQFILAGGVAANSELRELVKEKMKEKYPNIDYIIPPLKYCTDNAAMIAASGYIAYKKGIRANYDIGAKASLDLDNKTLNKKES
ncbi:MAG TPA: tRNA (adenosine(37)-N6)-threonylcarbamoyltransferase complex transferase subunit TsaD [Erysipelotrichaceae bacterium]|jgi:N6-L-threonylcarbamoyladenine synthase|nr:tRNA (adenosine(37)-N6)-threonylcarbamoyltransferase complex transferase subunit TsaD [Erysipelotrichia bacterium]HPX32100.1 tRNA (adenosine(37)-N6)-threonylcarbamoyltransferase complex transferase subunit TsaD [Erysipelotrichaceae bacterium]HQA84567.1 tRNA (adenosine(37)-N6)-threonylcarbamoyltransferase complex transferase subunit TsaD [Erysipelotrichaceae bacterium]